MVGNLEKALLWLRYQDSNECGLLEVHEAMDWADLFANRYNVLFDNVLYAAAWKCMGHMADALNLPSSYYYENARDVKKKINILLWITPENQEKMDWVKRSEKNGFIPLRGWKQNLWKDHFIFHIWDFVIMQTGLIRLAIY